MTRVKKEYLEALAKKVLIFDGAMGTSLQLMGLGPQEFGSAELVGCNDALVLNFPAAIEKVHRSFLEAGADVLETDTFRANRLTLQDYGLQDRVIELNSKAAALAKRLANEYSTPEKPRFAAGSVGPSGKLISTDDPQMSDITFDELAEIFREQARGLIQGGADLLIVETSQDILEVKAAIEGFHRAFKDEQIILPIQAQVTLDITGKMLLGTDITAALSILEGIGVSVIGMNCSTGPDQMRPSIQYLSEHTSLPISCIPNAGLPMNVNGEAVYPMQAEPFSDLLAEYVKTYGIRVVGGCCGTKPEHIKALADKISGLSPIQKAAEPVPSLASSTQSVALEQIPVPFIIGERLNAQGSRNFKKMLLAEDFDSMIQLARDQVENGAHALDISVAVTERADEEQLMTKLVKRLTLEVPVPLAIDSTEPDVIEAALKIIPGRSLINSTHFESGEAKSRRIFAMAKKYSAAVLCLTIDEKGMAKTAERKLEIAQRLYDMAVNEFDLRPEDLIFDDLTFTLATGEAEYADSAKETLKGLQLIKQSLPGVHTSLGVSNVSFGLSPAARKAVNSIFLYHCTQSGLDMAIVNAAQIKPYAEIAQEQRDLVEALIFNTNEHALADLITYFDTHASQEDSAAFKVNPFEGLDAAERLKKRIITRHKQGVESDIDELLALEPHRPIGEKAVGILNQVLLPAMKEVGDRFGAGELILPFVLQSAEVMKKSVSYLENFLDKASGTSKGKLVLATVYGDVHDIGKNLVKTILSNNGYEVIDLGKQVPAEQIIKTAVEEKADSIGLSALLVSTSKQMPFIVNELQRRRLDIPVLIGGAAINPRFGWRILQTEDGSFYEPGVFYCKDAFEGLAVMDKLSHPEKRAELLAETRKKVEHELDVAGKVNKPQRAGGKSAVKPAEFIPTVKTWGSRVVRQIPLQALASHLNLNELYRLSWGAKNTHGEAWQELQKQFDLRRESMLASAQKEGWLKPQAVYGYWPVLADGEELIVFDPQSITGSQAKELTRLALPRQASGEGLSLADYFLPVGSKTYDVLPLQVVTVSESASHHVTQLEAANDYSESYFAHGLAVQMAEATADYLHEHIRRELGLKTGQGLRYSWGYPAIPDLSDHAKIFQLLPSRQELGMSLTDAFQLVPEQSTAAMIVHHPEARYFNLGISRVNQLLG
ncbi:MAG: methionine synthase [Anaerolineaceae bacterium]|nr:methionine synthase [Anaerolineaceae bacterium]